MTVGVGTRIGPYEILSLIGAGGMGEVYKARDARLDRCVAVKLLHAEFAERPDRRARFEIEARAIAALSNTHICTLFDIGAHENRSFLVMELLEGETLDDRLTRGPLPPADVLRYGAEIADALAHAHAARIVHRDVKPSNVMITAAGAKLLDFGLARTVPVTASSSSSAVSIPHSTLTVEGTLVGTFQYMAPEQLEGKAVDARTDIFAFGTVLYEMATGRKAFSGTSQASLIAAILTEQPPPVSSISAPRDRHASPLFALDRVVERCLMKSPNERWQSARDLKLELDWITRSNAPAPVSSIRRTTRLREALAWTLALIAAVFAAALAFGALDRDAPPGLTRFTVAPPTGTTIGVPENRTRIAISSDGRRLAFVVFTGGRQHIWLRSLDSIAAEPLGATEGGESPFWSPDSRFIGFFSSADGQLKKVDVTGGPARTICAAEMEGAPVWGRDGTILFTQRGQGVYRVPADGGMPVQVTTVDKSRREMNHLWPQFLPDGRRFLYMATSRDAEGVRETPSVYVASLDSPEVRLLTRMPSRMVYAAPGYLLFVEDATLLAQAFDASTLRLTGEAMRIADRVAYSATLGNGGFTISNNGVLAVQGSGDPYSVTWYDRRGNAIESTWPEQTFGSVRISPDGQRIAVDVTDPRTGTADIWIYDVARGAPVRFTTDPTNDSQAVWSPDGKRLLFRSERRGAPSLYEKSIGTGSEILLASEPIPLTPEDWSPDGHWIAYVRQSRQTSWDLWLMPLTGDRKPLPFSATRFQEWGARFSPDSRWIAFTSTESGSPEVYVASLQEPGNRHRISLGGGSTPRWRGDGRELYYASADNRSIFAVSIKTTLTFTSGTPTRLLSVGAVAVARDRARNVAYDVTADGERFLVSVPAGEPESSRVTVILNWMAALRP